MNDTCLAEDSVSDISVQNGKVRDVLSFDSLSTMSRWAGETPISAGVILIYVNISLATESFVCGIFYQIT